MTAPASALRSRAGADSEPAAQLPTEITAIRFNSGQSVVPYFEGWIRNADGTFDMVFGYFNRNYQQEFAIPAGPDNNVEPRSRCRAADVLPAATAALRLPRARSRRLRQERSRLDDHRQRPHRDTATATCCRNRKSPSGSS